LFMMLRKKEIKHLEWFNLVFIALASIILAVSGTFGFDNGTIYYAGEPLSMVFFVLFIALMIAFAVFPIMVVKKSNLDSEYRSDHILFIVSVSQLVTSILLNTWFLSILYGQAVAVLLPARLITNIFLIPLYTIMLVGLLKILPSFIKQR
ncbi:MAG: folate family ECF transporter S component, partial [Firmicutes bacterium HGW-Firmicutes-3]